MNQASRFRIAVAAQLLLAAVAAAAAESPAYVRWGMTRPVADTATEARLVSAYTQLYGQRFADARAAYESLAARYPDCAEAHLGLSMAMRGQWKLDDAARECWKARGLDSAAVGVELDYADLVSPMRGARLPESLDNARRLEVSTEALLAASRSRHPLSAYAFAQLWANYLFMGRPGPAHDAMDSLGARNYFPPLVKELAYNLLAGLDSNAVLITGGDNGTYPLLAAQAHDRLRTDVSVVNLSVLNSPVVCRLLRDSMNVPISWSDAQLDSFQPAFDSARRTTLLAADLLTADIIANAAARKRPVYFAAFVPPPAYAAWRGRLVLEGLVRRVAAAPVADSIDMTRVTRNMTSVYRLGSLGRPVDWPANLSPLTRDVAPLGMNYVTLYALLARRYAGTGRETQARDCYRRMVAIVKVTGNSLWMKSVLGGWRRFRPDDLELKALLAQYPGN